MSQSKHAQQYTIYTLPRVFRDDAKLHPFLAEKRPDLIKLNKKDYTLYDVLLGLRQVISKEKLYDPNNTTVIICSPGLEAAIDMKSMHVTEVRDLVLLQMDVAHPDLLASLAPPQPQQQPQTVAAGGQPVFDTNGQFWVKPLFMQVLRSIPGTPPNKVVFSYKEVTSYLSEYILEHQAKFFDKRNIKVAHVENDPLGRAFGVKVFHRTQVTALLRKQLIPFKPTDKGSVKGQNGGPDQNSSQPKILRFTSLPSSNELKIGQPTLIVQQAVSVPGSQTPAELITNPSSRKRSHLDNVTDSKDETSSPSRRMRRTSSFSVTITKEDTRDSDDETIYSAQGYDTKDAADDDQDMSDNDCDTDEHNDFDVYDVEYEPEGVSSDDEQTANSKGKNGKKRSEDDNSDIDSDIDEAIIVTATALELLNTDQSYDEADESSDQDEMENAFNGVDLENGDKWKCQDCKTPNTPYIRFCSACYKERKGWLPERPKPKHKKNKNINTGELNVSKSKRTNGLSVKNSSQTQIKDDDVHEGDQSIHEGCSKNNGHNDSAVVVAGGSKFNLERSLSYTSAGTSSSSQDSGFSEPICTTEGSTHEIDAHESSDDETLSKIEKSALTKGISISSSTPSMLCTLCCAQPKNACLVHGRISHQVCCYGCARKLFKNKRPCPVCRRRIEKITKNIIA